MKYRLETFFFFSTWRRAAEASIDYFFLYLLLIFYFYILFFFRLCGEKLMRSERRAYSNVSSHSAFRDDARVHMIISQYSRGKIGKIKNWQFDGSIHYSYLFSMTTGNRMRKKISSNNTPV